MKGQRSLAYLGDNMNIYKCDICGVKKATRGQIRKHFKLFHKVIWRNMCDSKNESRRAGQPFRHSDPLSEKYTMVKK